MTLTRRELYKIKTKLTEKRFLSKRKEKQKTATQNDLNLDEIKPDFCFL